jgi:hypothetical protein
VQQFFSTQQIQTAKENKIKIESGSDVRVTGCFCEKIAQLPKKMP